MIFENEQEALLKIKKYLSVPKWVADAREYHKEMKALIYGIDYKNLILRIEHIESTKKAAARNKYSRPIKDTNSKILRPVENVYSATGGGKVYNIPNEDDKKNFLKTVSNVRGGKSIEGWLKTFWSKDLYNVDPNGIVFLEYKEDIEVYPTYKSIDTIRYYESNGQRLYFVIFEPKQEKINEQNVNVWRIVDAEKDYTFIEQGGTFTYSEERSFEHPFGSCPALTCSDIHILGQCQRLAPIDDIKETEKEFIRDRSIKTIYKFLNGFSTPFRPKIICPDCKGTGKTGTETCSGCNGKGVLFDKDVTDEIIIPIQLDSDEPVQLPSNFAGFISPDIEIWNKYDEEANNMFEEMFESIWGTRESEAKDQTAMSVVLNTQPMISRLNVWSDVAEFMEWQLTEWIANWAMPTKSKSERISLITYGRNYIIQPPEFLIEKYQNSKEKGDSSLILDRMLSEYITSKYKNDPETLRVELIKKQLELYVHYTIEQVLSIYGQVEAQRKGLFSAWWETKTNEEILNGTIYSLKLDRDKWIQGQINNLKTVQDGNGSSE
jgi:hypothetical protein